MRKTKEDIFKRVPIIHSIEDVETFLNQKGRMVVLKGRIVFMEEEENEL